MCSGSHLWWWLLMHVAQRWPACSPGITRVHRRAPQKTAVGSSISYQAPALWVACIKHAATNRLIHRPPLTPCREMHFSIENVLKALFPLLTAAPRKEVYFMAVIDILTHYDAKKKAAHAAKTVKHGVSICLNYRPI